MAYNNTVTVVGNVVRNPEIHVTEGGTSVLQMSVGYNKPPPKGQGAPQPSFFDVTAFNSLAENAAQTVRKGMRVVVQGELTQRRWTNKEGENRTKVQINADEISPSLRWATADVTRNPYTSEQQGVAA